MSAETTLLGLAKPAGSEPFARSVINGNMDIVDKFAICAYAFNNIPYPGLSKGVMSFDGNGKPSSQSISGPNGLTGSMTYSFTDTTITETLSITAPSSWSVTRTTTIADLSESCS